MDRGEQQPSGMDWKQAREPRSHDHDHGWIDKMKTVMIERVGIAAGNEGVKRVNIHRKIFKPDE